MGLMAVYCHGGTATMTEHLLDDAFLNAEVKQVGGEAVSEAVDSRFRIDTRDVV